MRFPVLALLLVLPFSVSAREVSWMTDGSVGASEIALTIDITCTGNPILCPFMPPYSSTRTATLSGSGTGELGNGALSLDLDTLVTIPDAANEQAWVTSFPSTAFDDYPGVGVPLAENGIVFFTSGGPLLGAGIGQGPVGPIAVAETLPMGLKFDLNGLEVLGVPVPLFDQVVAPGETPFAGSFEMPDALGYELRDFTTTFSGSSDSDLDPGTLSVGTSGSVTLNLSGQYTSSSIPLPLWTLVGLAPALALLIATRARGDARSR